MSINPEQSGAVIDFSSTSQEKTEGGEIGNGLIKLEQMMTTVFMGERGKTQGSEQQEQVSLNEGALPIELVANPNQMEKPPEEDNREIRNEVSPSLRPLSTRINAGSPTGQELPVYDVDTDEVVVEESATEKAEQTDKVEPVKQEELLEEKPDTEEVVKDERQKEETIEEKPVEAAAGFVEEEQSGEKDELSARRLARERLRQMQKLSNVDAQLLTTQVKREQLEQLENRTAA